MIDLRLLDLSSTNINKKVLTLVGNRSKLLDLPPHQSKFVLMFFKIQKCVPKIRYIKLKTPD